MGLFGNDKAEEIDELWQRINVLNSEMKSLKKLLSQERAHVLQMTGEVEQLKAEVEKAKRSMQRARQRQKASIARANRFKARLNVNSGTAGL